MAVTAFTRDVSVHGPHAGQANEPPVPLERSIFLSAFEPCEAGHTAAARRLIMSHVDWLPATGPRSLDEDIQRSAFDS
jgi:hypothetical protein